MDVLHGSTHYRGDSTWLSHLPIELHKAWLRLLDQPTLLRVGALSKSWRALAQDGPSFYLAVHLQAIRGRHERFIRHLAHARKYQRPIAIILDFPYSPTKISRGLLATEVSPAIEQAMKLVRKISIISGAPLPGAALEFLLVPAPDLREFIYRIDVDLDGDEEEYDSYSNSDSGFYSYSDWSAMSYARLPPIVDRLFARSAPKLTSVDLYGVTLPERTVEAFSKATHVKLGELQPIPSIGFAAHFPVAKHLKLTTLENDLPKTASCSRASWLPSSLVSLDLDDSAIILPKLLQLFDTAPVQHLRINFNAHYSYENTNGVSVMRTKSDMARIFKVRDADWAQCLAHVSATPLSLEIFSTKRTSTGLPEDIYATVRSAREARTVTFYADEAFVSEERRGGEPYNPLSSLASLSPTLTEITLALVHLLSIFHIADSLLALRLLHVHMDGQAELVFWDVADCATAETCPLDRQGIPTPGKYTLACPSLDSLILSSDTGGAIISSHELAHFGYALGIVSHRQQPPNLVLRGVSIEEGTHHERAFALWSVFVCRVMSHKSC